MKHEGTIAQLKLGQLQAPYGGHNGTLKMRLTSTLRRTSLETRSKQHCSNRHRFLQNYYRPTTVHRSSFPALEDVTAWWEISVMCNACI